MFTHNYQTRTIIIHPDSELEEEDLSIDMDIDDVADVLGVPIVSAHSVNELTLWGSSEHQEGDVNKLATQLIADFGIEENITIYGNALLVAHDDDLRDVTDEELQLLGLDIS